MSLNRCIAIATLGLVARTIMQEFEFESETAVGENMSVAICVTGCLKDHGDLQRAYGVEPRGRSVSAVERLSRFYYVHNRDKVVSSSVVV